jgi:dihydroxyacetone kinase
VRSALRTLTRLLLDLTRVLSFLLVDPLEAFVNAFSSNSSDLAGAVQAAVDAAAHTAKIDAKAGRAAYVGREELAKANVPDPGAHGVAILLQGLLKSLQ